LSLTHPREYIRPAASHPTRVTGTSRHARLAGSAGPAPTGANRRLPPAESNPLPDDVLPGATGGPTSRSSGVYNDW